MPFFVPWKTSETCPQGKGGVAGSQLGRGLIGLWVLEIWARKEEGLVREDSHPGPGVAGGAGENSKLAVSLLACEWPQPLSCARGFVTLRCPVSGPSLGVQLCSTCSEGCGSETPDRASLPVNPQNDT